MHPFASYVLQNYYKQTGWNEDNLYTNLTRSSAAILDFTVPRGLHFNISKSPNALFNTTYSMNALPSLNGSIGYIFTSCELDIKDSTNARFKDIVERFRVYDQPRRPEGREEVWYQGERVDKPHYLLYGRMYVPTGRLDALYASRLSPTLQLVVAAISDPRRPISSVAPGRRGRSDNNTLSNIIMNLQHDVGRWCTEYSWSAQDQMLGLRVLHNFGRGASARDDTTPRLKRVDEEDAMEGGLKGRFSAGAELYFSAKEKSAGVSTGLRFTTLPDATPPSFTVNGNGSSTVVPTQPPTTITAVFNPMMGHLSGAYAARVTRDLSLGSRFEFNVYSYESEWTMGAEWWTRRGPQPDSIPLPISPKADDDVQSVVKARVSTNADVSLMWEGRIRNVLVSLGVVSDLKNRSKPIKTIGLEMAYFSSS